MEIEVVSNPRKRRKYRRKTTRRRKRRNPVLASIGNPRRRRRRSAPRSYRRRAYRRNPRLLGLPGFDFSSAAYVALGMIGSDMVPNLVRRFWPGLPSTGIANYAVKIGGTVVMAYGVKMFTRSTQKFQMVMIGGLSLLLVDLFRMYVAPKIPFLSGMGADESLVYAGELEDVYEGTAGYVKDSSVDGYVQEDLSGSYRSNPVGAY